jgi:HEAT repeat protein
MRERRLRRRSKTERLAARGDVRRLIRLIGKHDWLVDADGHARDLAVGRRIEAVAALGSIESGEAEAGILLALADDDPRVKLAAVEALGPNASARAAKVVARAAAAWRDPSLSRARAAALELLISMADEVLAVVFAEALVDDPQRAALSGDEEAQLRRVFDVERGRATMVLAERLVQRLASPDVRERRCVHQVIVVLGAVAVEPLVAALDDPARRAPACTGLAAIRDTRAVPALLPILDSASAQDRAMAARTLGAIRDPRALDDLMRAGKDADPDVRDAALDALDRLRSLVEALGAAALSDSADSRLEDSEGAQWPGGDNGLHPPLERSQRTLRQRLLGKPPWSG